VTRPCASNQLLDDGAVELIGTQQDGNDQEGCGSPAGTSPQDQPQPETDKHDTNGEKLVVIGDDRPEEVADGVGQGPVDEVKDRHIQSIEQIRHAVLPPPFFL
jgi:hypothetical protein